MEKTYRSNGAAATTSHYHNILVQTDLGALPTTTFYYHILNFLKTPTLDAFIPEYGWRRNEFRTEISDQNRLKIR